MKITFFKCSRTQNSDWIKPTELPYSANSTLDHLYGGSHAIVALTSANKLDDCLVGIWQFEYHEGTKTLKSKGTWVNDKYRKNGIASTLWNKGLAWVKPRIVKVTVCSDRGLTLILSLQERFWRINWIVKKESHGRGLRNLNQNRKKGNQKMTVQHYRRVARKEYPTSSRIAKMIYKGKTTKQIMNKLGCSQQTVAAVYCNLSKYTSFSLLMEKCGY